jgi:hypothetical protein
MKETCANKSRSLCKDPFICDTDYELDLERLVNDCIFGETESQQQQQQQQHEHDMTHELARILVNRGLEEARQKLLTEQTAASAENEAEVRRSFAEVLANRVTERMLDWLVDRYEAGIKIYTHLQTLQRDCTHLYCVNVRLSHLCFT